MDFASPPPPQRRQLRASEFLHLTYPPPPQTGQPAPTSRLQVIVSPAGMPRRELPPACSVPTRSQEVAGPSRALHTQPRRALAPSKRWRSVRPDSLRGGCQSASSAPRASQECERACVEGLGREGQSSLNFSLFSPKTLRDTPPKGAYDQTPTAEHPPAPPSPAWRLQTFQRPLLPFLPSGTRAARGVALGDTRTVGS